jgi:hypothetical protein
MIKALVIVWVAYISFVLGFGYAKLVVDGVVEVVERPVAYVEPASDVFLPVSDNYGLVDTFNPQMVGLNK